MCGLFGFAPSTRWSHADCHAALALLHHRGPNHTGEWCDEQVYIAHQRLSIIDISASGRQPMCSGPVVMAANGEIYNFSDLRSELRKNFQFSGHSDSEVLLHGYRAWGIEELLERIDGMYAFVIYDALRNRLFLARDRVGIKPLYYASFPDHFVWASELKAIQSLLRPGPDAVDRTALYDFLTYNYIPSPKTMYRDVRKLEAAHYLEVDLHTYACKVHRYWQLSTRVIEQPPMMAAERTRELVRSSVRSHLVSDVPVGCFLSGGIDSTILAFEASKAIHGLRTFCISFPESSHDESHFAEIAANSLGTLHNCKQFPSHDMATMIERTSEWYDEPFADMSAWPTYLVSAFAREQVTVSLSGDGGDEIFGGYARYAQYLRYRAAPDLLQRLLRRCILRPLRLMPRNARSRRPFRSIELTALDDLELYVRLTSGLLRHEKQAYATQWSIPADYDDYWHFKRYYRPELPALTRLQYLDFHTYLPDDILTKVDRASMAVSLEARVPYLARDIVEFAFSLPEATRFAGGSLKGLLKLAYAGRIPDSILNRPKKGFSVPSGRYLAPFIRPGESAQELMLRKHRIMSSLGF